jgi:hypothetical protein
MEIKGKLVQVMPVESGESKSGSSWKKVTAVIETEGQYPKKVAIEAWGDNVGKVTSFREGTTLIVGLDVESREYAGKWYNSIKGWKWNVDGAAENRAANAANAAYPTTTPPKEEDYSQLPF